MNDVDVRIAFAKSVYAPEPLGHPIERLYREVRALRIYEGTSEIQKLILAEQLLKDEAARKGTSHA